MMPGGEDRIIKHFLYDWPPVQSKFDTDDNARLPAAQLELDCQK
jgi:hypothetical protein